MNFNIRNFYNLTNLEHYRNVRDNVPNIKNNFAILKLCVYNKDDTELIQQYIKRIELHNQMCANSKFIDSGFDLLVPTETIINNNFISKFIDMGVKTEMIYCDIKDSILTTCAFNVHPRSSISKTNLMLSNHTGVIDAGYRGPIIGAFRWLKPETDDSYTIDQYTRLVQVCHPSLCPIYVIMVDETDLSFTERGECGFGSTGK
jgi:dUTPase